MTVDKEIALSVYFTLKIDNFELGQFNSCEGLGVEVVIEQREEGGNNGFVWQLPTRIKYPNVKLTRPLTEDTRKIAKWLTDALGGHPAARKGTASIVAMTPEKDTIASWGLRAVVPVRWTGPTFNPDTPKVAIETLEIAHHGFID